MLHHKASSLSAVSPFSYFLAQFMPALLPFFFFPSFLPIHHLAITSPLYFFSLPSLPPRGSTAQVACCQAKRGERKSIASVSEFAGGHDISNRLSRKGQRYIEQRVSPPIQPAFPRAQAPQLALTHDMNPYPSTHLQASNPLLLLLGHAHRLRNR